MHHASALLRFLRTLFGIPAITVFGVSLLVGVSLLGVSLVTFRVSVLGLGLFYVRVSVIMLGLLC